MSKKKHKKPSNYQKPEEALAEENLETTEDTVEEQPTEEVVNEENSSVNEGDEALVEEQPTEEAETQPEEPQEVPADEAQPEESQKDVPEEQPTEEAPASEAQPEESQEDVPEEQSTEEVPSEENAEETEAQPEEQPAEEGSEEQEGEIDEETATLNAALLEAMDLEEDKPGEEAPAAEEASETTPEETSEETTEQEEADDKEQQYADLPRIPEDCKMKISEYIESGYQFFEYDLLDVLRNDIVNNEPSDLDSIFEYILTTDFARNHEVIGMFMYFATTGKYSLTPEMIISSLPNDVKYNSVYYFAALNALKYYSKENKSILDTFVVRLSGKDDTGYAKLLKVHKKYRVYSLFDHDQSYKSLKTVKGLYNKYRKKDTELANYIIRDVFDIYGLSFYKKYKKGLKYFTKISSDINNTIKEYCLLRVAHNYLIHYEFKKATKIYESVAKIATDKYNATLYLMLAKSKVRIFGELAGKRDFKNTDEYKQIRNTAIELNIPAYTDRFDNQIKSIKSQERYETEYNFGQVRRMITGFAFTFLILTIILDFFIVLPGLKIFESILAAAIVGIQFLTLHLKRRLVPLIICSAFAVILLVLAFILC